MFQLNKNELVTLLIMVSYDEERRSNLIFCISTP